MRKPGTGPISARRATPRRRVPVVAVRRERGAGSRRGRSVRPGAAPGRRRGARRFLPRHRTANDEPEVVVARRPVHACAQARGVADEDRRIARTARAVADVEVDPRFPAHRLEDRPDRVAAAIAAVEHAARGPALEVPEDGQMDVGEIGDMDVVAHAGPVRRVVVGAEHGHRIARSRRRLAGDLDEVRGTAAGRTRAPLRVGARDVAVAKRGIAQVMGGRRVVEHPLGHQLGAAIGVGGRGGGLFRHRRCGRHAAVNAGARCEDEPAHPARDAGLEQRRAHERVVPVVLEGIDDRLRHRDAGGEMDDRGDAVFGDDGADGAGVPGVALDERHLARHGRAPARGEVVEHDHPVAGVAKGQHGVAAHIAGAPRNQQRAGWRHGKSGLARFGGCGSPRG